MLPDFDDWIVEEFARGPFTALILVFEVGDDSVDPVASTYLHIIGDEVDWAAMRRLLKGAPNRWNAVAFFVSRDPKTGPISDRLAKLRLLDTEERVKGNRLELNQSAFFDNRGRRMQVEEAGEVKH